MKMFSAVAPLRRKVLSVATGASMLVASWNCAPTNAETTAEREQAEHIAEVVATGGVVDSILPLDEQLRRFRSEIPSRPDTLRHASRSIDQLVQRWARAVSTHDSLALNRMALDRAEFAWLYYPGSKLSLPPYEAPPQLLWGQILASSNQGAQHVLERFGGKRFTIEGVACGAPTDSTTSTIVYSICSVRVVTSSGHEDAARLFGSIVEHQGRFKFLGFVNSL